MDLDKLLTIDNVDTDQDHDTDEPQSSSSSKSSRKRKFESMNVPTPSQATPREELVASSSVGYAFDPADPSIVFIRCPIGVINHRQGIHACILSGKASVSSFKCLGYSEESDTSLIECGLYTGRTHQLRLHLQLLGNPIANDPCYGGELYYGDPARRMKAEQILLEMRTKGYHLLTKPPHLSSDHDDSIATLTYSDEVTQVPLVEDAGEASVGQLEGESDEDYLKRTCRYCRERSTLELETSLHCNGIWLHALRYESKGQWRFETPIPDWASVFSLSSS
jgi:hypothetical protein